MAGSADWLTDKIRFEQQADWLIEVIPDSPADVATPLRFSRHGFKVGGQAITSDQGDVIAAHIPFHKRLDEAPTIRQAMWSSGKIGGGSFRKPGEIVLVNTDGVLDQYMESEGWKWKGRPVKIYLVDRLSPANTIVRRFTGFVQNAKWDLDRLRLSIEGPESKYEIPTSSRVYRGHPYTLELAGGAGGTDNADLSFGSPAKLDITGDLTLRFWIWFETFATVNVHIWGWLGGTGRPWFLLLSDTFTPANIYICGSIGGSNEIAPFTDFNLVTGRWYHIAIVVDGQDATLVGWDEAEQKETIQTIVGAFSSATRDAASGSSCRWRGRNSRTFWINELIVQDEVIAIEDIRAQRHSPFDENDLPASVKLYAPVTDGTGLIVADKSATPSDGTITTTLAGTTTWLPTVEGSPELAGTPKPDLWGYRFGIAPIHVNPTINAYQVAGGGPIYSIVPFLGGLVYGALPYTVVTSLRQFLTATPLSNEVVLYMDEGLFRLGDTPTLPLYVSGVGYTASGVPTVASAGSIVRHILAERAGLTDPDDFDTAAFDALDDVAPHFVGLYLAEPVSIVEAVDRLLGSVLGFWGHLGDSDLVGVGQFTGPAAIADHSFTQEQIKSIVPLDVETIWHELRLRYRPSDAELSNDQIAGLIQNLHQSIEWRKKWLDVLIRDPSVRKDWPGKASQSKVIETLLYLRGSADSADVSGRPNVGSSQEAARRMALFSVPRRAYQVTLDVTAAAVRIGKTLALTYIGQVEGERLNLSSDRFQVLSLNTALQRGEVILEVWG